MDYHQEVWAEAQWVERNKCDEGQHFMAEQIMYLATKADEAGVARWRQIAAAYDQLRSGSPQ